MLFSIKRAMPALFLAALPVVGQAAELESLQDRFSYALGYQFGQQLKTQGLTVQGDVFGAAINDVMQGKTTAISFEEMRQAVEQMKAELIADKKAKADQANQKGDAFLSENGAKEGITTLPSGLQYKVVKAGEGAVPPAGSSVTVHYRGTLMDGKEFDSSYARNEPAVFSMDGVIPGFKEGLSLMNKGAKWMLYIPSKLGYGAMGVPGSIGPNELLIFEVELISFEAAKAEPAKLEQPKAEK